MRKTFLVTEYGGDPVTSIGPDLAALMREPIDAADPARTFADAMINENFVMAVEMVDGLPCDVTDDAREIAVAVFLELNPMAIDVSDDDMTCDQRLPAWFTDTMAYAEWAGEAVADGLSTAAHYRSFAPCRGVTL